MRPVRSLLQETGPLAEGFAGYWPGRPRAKSPKEARAKIRWEIHWKIQAKAQKEL